MAELDPRTAASQARAMRDYVQSFAGQKFSPAFDSVDRLNLATALDNLEETAAMLLNMAERATPAPGAPEQEAAEKMAKLLEEARSDGCESIREWIDSLKQSVGTYRLERNSARDAYRRHRDESEARGKLINIVLGMVGAPPGANVVMAVAAALPPSAAWEKTS